MSLALYGFSDSDILAKSIGVVSWEKACERDPRLRDPLPASPG